MSDIEAAVDSRVSRTRVAPHLPGEAGVWVFIGGDVIVFSIFFLTFLHYRGLEPELFAQSQAALNQTFGVLNTFFMLTSSWFVATAVHAARHRKGKVTPIFFLLAIACGLCFAVVKVLEYSEKIEAGHTLSSNNFFMLYYMFTGIHFLHVLIGMAVLALLTRLSWNGRVEGSTLLHLESGASFWHLVDLLWIVLFALIYLVK
jgi:nitric oxide reductase NorE protein